MKDYNDSWWYNELGSAMHLFVNGKSITGTYHTVVGDANGEYDLVGQIDIDSGESSAIGFVVVWNNASGSSDSVTAWSGQFKLVGQTPTILTTWLLTKETALSDDWRSTIVGKDRFTPVPIDEEQIKFNRENGSIQSFPSK